MRRSDSGNSAIAKKERDILNLPHGENTGAGFIVYGYCRKSPKHGSMHHSGCGNQHGGSAYRALRLGDDDDDINESERTLGVRGDGQEVLTFAY